jgi:hypothetical protein
MFSVMHSQGSGVYDGHRIVVAVACLSTSKWFTLVAGGESCRNLADTPEAVARAASPQITMLNRIFLLDDDGVWMMWENARKREELGQQSLYLNARLLKSQLRRQPTGKRG